MTLLLLIAPTSLTFFFFFFNHPPTPEIYTLSLHDALPILPIGMLPSGMALPGFTSTCSPDTMESPTASRCGRSEEHTSELQSRGHLVCRLLLEKKKKNNKVQ